MACLSPSPSGRRLSELLEEKQEPFFLDLHLLEKGCSSSRLLDGYDDTAALCWPAAPGNAAAAAVLKRLTSKNNASSSSRGGRKQKQRKHDGGLLQLLLSKILHGKAAAAGRKKPAVLQFSDSFKAPSATNPAALAPAPRADRYLGAVKTAGEVREKEMETEWSSYSDSDDDEKQLSPVSVLDHPFESAPVLGKLCPVNGKLSPSKNSMVDVFRQLLDAAYTPVLLAKSDDLVVKDTSAVDAADDEYYYGYRTSPKNGRYDGAAYWEAHRAELARVSALVASEVPNARLAHADLLADREDVGAGVAAAVLDVLMHELVVDLGSC